MLRWALVLRPCGRHLPVSRQSNCSITRFTVIPSWTAFETMALHPMGRLLLGLVCATALAALLVAASGSDAGLAAARLVGGSRGVVHQHNGTSAASAWSSWQRLWHGTPPLVAKPKAQLLRELREENVWKNDLVLWILPAKARAAMPMVLQVGGRAHRPNGRSQQGWWRRVRTQAAVPPAAAAAVRRGACYRVSSAALTGLG